MGVQVATLSYEEIKQHHPDVLLPPDAEFADDYFEFEERGLLAAKSLKVAFVAICRNAMPFLPFTLGAVSAAGSYFADWKAFVFENDSTDETKDALSAWADGTQRFCEIQDLGLPHLNFTTETCRTVPLAQYRNRCRQWVDGVDADIVVVFDTDPWGGFSVGGVMNTVGHMTSGVPGIAGMASYSWVEWGPPAFPIQAACHYDAFACRWNWWQRRRDMLWFHLWHPPVGSPPVRLNSAFGQLAVYRRENFLRGVYDGSDCEHVGLHRSMGGDLYLNPSMRCVSFWIPEGARMPEDGGSIEDDGLHDDVHPDVGRRHADSDNCSDTQDLG
jgi:hypothetical protein